MFFSANYTQQYLKKCYEQQLVENPEQKAYENCYPFIYYLEHGKVYYEQSKISPLIIQPILLFYGLVHLIKACILTVDPNYPETTSVLAHGVSARKRKKQQFHFFEDEVKFQKTGLFPFLSKKLFHMEQLEGDKMSMGSLFKQIPELNSLITLFDGTPSFATVRQEGNDFYIPKKVLDFFHMTENRFVDFFVHKSIENFTLKKVDGDFMVFVKEYDNESFNHTPLKYNLYEHTYSLPLTKDRGFVFHELLIHYLLLYNLSMIARYETEWWSELVKTMPNKDFPLIETFLQITLEKGPFLVCEYLSKATINIVK